MDLSLLVPDRDARVPLAVQLADGLRTAARAGAVRVGDRLPSTRSLAADLGVSRTVTAAAYDQLLAEGWVAGRRGAGTFVVAVPPGVRGPAAGPRPDAAPARAGAVDLRAGTPCVAVLDRAAWRRAWRAAADDPPDVVPDPVGLPAFREAVVAHLCAIAACPPTRAPSWPRAERPRRSPSWPGPCRAARGSPSRSPGTSGPPRRCGPPDSTWSRCPSTATGWSSTPSRPGLAAVYCTPAHQFPLGARLSAGRRVALVDRARTEGFLVVEDDYDGELRYDVAPLPLLAALGPDVVVHLGTASKLLTPTLGVGWLVAPPAVRDAVVAQRDRAGVRPARAGQRVFAALAAHGDLGRHLRRLRRELAQRRRATVTAVAAAGRPVQGDAAGAHVVVPLGSGRRGAGRHRRGGGARGGPGRPGPPPRRPAGRGGSRPGLRGAVARRPRPARSGSSARCCAGPAGAHGR